MKILIIDEMHESIMPMLQKEGHEVIYSPDKPLSCGARMWIECDSDDVKMFDKEGKENAT